MFSLAGLRPLPVEREGGTRRAARAAGRDVDGARRRSRAGAPAPPSRRRRRRARGRAGARATCGSSSTTAPAAGAAALRGLDLECRAGRDGRAAGPKRRGQEHAAARRGRAARARPRDGRGARARSRCCCRRPSDYLLHERVARRAAARPSPPRRSSELGLEHARRRATRATSPAASGSAWRSGSCSPGAGIGGGDAAGGDRARRADARHGPRRRRRGSPSGCARSPPRGAAVVVATHDVEFAARARATAACCSARGRVVADGPTARGALGRPLLRDRGRARARARRPARCCPRRARRCSRARGPPARPARW